MNKTETISGIQKKNFVRVVDGKETGLFILTNKAGFEASVTNYGAKVVTLHVPDKNKKLTDVVLGHSTIDEYLLSPQKSFGAIIGRVANRIAGGKFTLDDKEYTLICNGGANNVHGGPKGFSFQVWDAKQLDDSTLELTYLSVDGDQGFPGNLKTVVTYKLTEDGALEIHYEATTDKKTILNLTHHSFFNLSGAGSPTITDHILTVYADGYTPGNENCIPTGQITPVAGTPFDFTTAHAVGERIDADDVQLQRAKGYDHNYVLRRAEGNTDSILAAKAISPVTGIAMEVYTTEPGLQVYAGNGIGEVPGKERQTYLRRSGLCLEGQHYPDSIHQPNFPSVILLPGSVYTQTTIYKFSLA